MSTIDHDDQNRVEIEIRFAEGSRGLIGEPLAHYLCTVHGRIVVGQLEPKDERR